MVQESSLLTAQTLDTFIEESSQLTDQASLVELFEKITLSLGFDKFIYSFITEQAALKEEARHGIISHYPEDWMCYYAEHDYLHYDPTYRAAMRKAGVFSWKALEEESQYTPKEYQLMREAEGASLKSGVSVAIHGPHHEIVGFGFASDHDHGTLPNSVLYKLYAAAQQFHLIYSTIHRLQPECLAEDVYLTPREKEILLQTAKGRSASVIAQVLSISEDTVNFHLRNIYRKLGVNHKVSAVLKAYKKGLISI